MNISTLGWALVVVGAFLGVAGAILGFAGQQLIANPAQLFAGVSSPVDRPRPVLGPKQHKLLNRIWTLQIEHNLDHLWLGTTGWVGGKNLPEETAAALKEVDLKVELFGGPSVHPEEQQAPEYEALVNSLPEVYVRRVPGSFGLVFGSFVPVAITDEGIRYLRQD